MARSFSSCDNVIVACQTIAGRAAGTLNAATQLAVSTNPSKLRRPRRTLADVVLSAALEMDEEPPAQRAEAPTAPQNAVAQLRASVCDTLGKKNPH